MIFYIAKHTVNELLHKKSFFLGILVALVCMVLAQSFVYLSPNAEQQFLTDFTFNAIKLVASIFMIFAVSDLFLKERLNKTQYFYFVNPVSDGKMILGKYFGVLFVLAILIFSVCFILYIFMIFIISKSNLQIWGLFFILWSQLMVLTCYGVLGSTIFSRGTNALFVFTIQLLSYFSKTIHHMITDHLDFAWLKDISWIKYFMDIACQTIPDFIVNSNIYQYIIKNPLSLIFPNFQSFDPLPLFVLGYPLDSKLLCQHFSIYITYVVVILFISLLFFKKFVRWNESS